MYRLRLCDLLSFSLYCSSTNSLSFIQFHPSVFHRCHFVSFYVFFFSSFLDVAVPFVVLLCFFCVCAHYVISFPIQQQVIRAERSDRWTLQIKFPQLRDAGIYECQVNTEPKMSMAFRLNIVGEYTIYMI